MAQDTNNLVVGAGRLFIAPTGTALPAGYDASGASGILLGDVFNDDAAWSDLGFTDGGVEVGYEPTYSDINVDQFKDAAKVFLESETMSFSTSLMEATLENLIVAWGRKEGDSLAVSTVNVANDKKTFSIGIGGDVACEYKVAIIVPAPGTEAACDGTAKFVQRLYVGNRIISVDGSTHGYRRTEATMFPVNFRALPYVDPVDPATTAGKEYGIVEDLTYTPA